MKKLVLSIFAAAAMMSSALAAELHLGVSEQMVKIEADGTETEGGENNTGSVSHTVPVGSIFAEITSGRFTLGLDYIPMDAEVSDATKKRTDTETSVTGTAAEITPIRSIDKINFNTGDNTTTFKFMSDFSELIKSSN